MVKPRIAIAALCGLLLAGCGGGGGSAFTGGTTPTTPATPTAPTTPTTPTTPTSGIAVNFQAASSMVTYQPASATLTSGLGFHNVAGSGAFPAGQGGTISVTTNSLGNISAITFNLTTSNVANNYTTNFTGPFTSFSSAGLSNLVSSLQGITTGGAGSNASGVNAVVISQVAGSQTLSYTAYGAWAINDSSASSRFGGFAIGNQTPATSVPITGTATYNGTATGTGFGLGGAAAVTGSVRIVANFAAANGTATMSNISVQNVATSVFSTIPNLTGTIFITGNAYGGQLSTTPPQLPVLGKIYGNFYGPTAQETGGVFSLTLTLPGLDQVSGSFGAKQ